MYTPTVIEATSVSNALSKGLGLMVRDEVVREESRNGTVLVYPSPVITHTLNPLRRVLFSPARDANPFFHLFESLWMLSGRNDLPWLAQFNKQMASYSDDGGKTQPAAYGHRWRNFFGFDQIVEIVEELKRNPGTRRAVLAMWNGRSFHYNGEKLWDADLVAAVNGSADVPCNTHCYFTLRDGKLDMGVMCRSNDLLWGAHGANAVHFSVLLEYIAASVGAQVGTMTQFSWNYHLYEGVLKHSIVDTALDVLRADAYDTDTFEITSPIFHPDTVDLFNRELPVFMDWAKPEVDPTIRARKRPPTLEHPFLAGTAIPMLRAWDWRKAADLRYATSCCHDIIGADWRKASMEWMQRRFDKLYPHWEGARRD